MLRKLIIILVALGALMACISHGFAMRNLGVYNVAEASDGDSSSDGEGETEYC